MLTLRALLDDPALELRLLEPGPAGALDAEVVWVHNTELPDPSPYVRERELVLTNGLWRDRVDPAEFVSQVAGANAAGIVFGLRVQTPRTPPEMVDACRDAGLPLLEISIAVPFTALSLAAAASYAEQRQDALVGMVRRGDALAGAISRGAGASGVLKVLRRDHDLPLAVVDRMGRALASAGTGLDNELDDAALRAVADGLARHPPPLELDLPGVGRATLFLVAAVGDVDAALLCLRPLSELGRAERDALEQAARFLSLEVAKQQAVQAIESRFASELLDMILSGPARGAEVHGRLRAFGIDPADPLVVCALAFAHGGAATLPGLGEAVGEFFLAEGVPVVVAGGSQDVVAVLPWRRPERELAELAGRLADSVLARFPGRRPVVGLGGLAEDAGGLRQPLARAREACRVLRRRDGPAVAAFGELSTYHLLLGMQDPRTLRGFADGVLGPVREHDVRRGGELEATLRAFLEHECHWANTAAALYVHVNTLRNRLARIAELTGRDVARTEDRVDLFLALAADAMS
ncbi:PucR family transcriptional regulator [Pseudonocardia acaciae]|uniref:PucR family transcriptional regulator n=1 Tax=Pseudonocardia acaciae TaxID=551276 RepID=UPI00048E5384|nr:PucR family transcriptional regulator [Pseudonocardia acaciae]